MITLTFLQRNGQTCGFYVRGHAQYAAYGRDIVCAAVSSAAIMTVNTVVGSCGCKALIRENAERGELLLSVVKSDLDACHEVLDGFLEHISSLCREYPQNIQLVITEVQRSC